MNASYITRNWLLLLLLLVIAACKKDYQETNKKNGPLQLSAAASTIVLQQKNESADGVVFNWTTGSNNGSNAAISYELKLDVEGNNFSKAVLESPGKAALTKKYTVKELNNLLLNHWNSTPGSAVTLQARVIATVMDGSGTKDSSDLLVKVTPYKPVSTTLYIIGDSAPNGWSAGDAEPLVADAVIPGLFTWQGLLTAGEFKLITTLGQFLPSYNKGAGSSALVFRSSDDDPDEKFSIPVSGIYNLTVNLLDLTIQIEETEAPPYTRLWMLGDAVPTGWDINNPAEMRVDSSNLFVFSYNEILNAGEFKIPVATGDFNTDYFMPLTNNPAITETGAQLVKNGNPDLKWKITTAGAYKIRLDIKANTISIKPFTPFAQVWMVGDATPAGWNIDNPTPMVKDPGNPYVFSFTGQLNIGEFKLPVETGDWGGDFFMPVLNNSLPGSTQMKFVPGGSPDFKWRITEAGNYTITINQLYDTISITKN